MSWALVGLVLPQAPDNSAFSPLLKTKPCLQVNSALMNVQVLKASLRE